jgi:UDP-N-acetylglucosamine 2-epimerase (non-hydrolysing)
MNSAEIRKPKLITIVGTRPELIRLSRIIPALDQNFDHVLVHTGQNKDRQLNEIFFEELGIRTPDFYLNVDTSSLATAIGEVFIKSENYIRFIFYLLICIGFSFLFDVTIFYLFPVQ